MGADRQKTARAGFDAHVVKPVSTDPLEALVQRLAGPRALAPA